MFFDHRVGYPAKEKRHLLETLLLTSETVWEGMLHYSVAGQAVLVGLETFPTVRDEKVSHGGREGGGEGGREGGREGGKSVFCFLFFLWEFLFWRGGEVICFLFFLGARRVRVVFSLRGEWFCL